MTELEKLVEKDAIRDQYYVYARALDRIDNPLGKTVFAEDAPPADRAAAPSPRRT